MKLPMDTSSFTVTDERSARGSTPGVFFLVTAIMVTIYVLDITFLGVVSLFAKASARRRLKAQAKAKRSPFPSSSASSSSGDNNVKRVSPESIDASIDVTEYQLNRHKPSVQESPRDDDDDDTIPTESDNTRKYLSGSHPTVLVQLPMYNEETCCELVIERCCKINWPSDKLIIQVCDDSTNERIKARVDAAIIAAIEAGHSVELVRRPSREGFKAGVLICGLEKLAKERRECKYVVIFDADFEPPEDYLYQTVPLLEADPKVALVQTRWTFSNVNTFLTWCQKINLDYHFEVEHTARAYLGWYFNFNGTAGTWRLSAIQDAGGWTIDTTVEDMDLSIRAYVRGWKFVYLNHVRNASELPNTLASYRTQQFRWLSGPMQVMSKYVRTIWSSKDIGFWHKLNCYWFFARYILHCILALVVIVVPPVLLFVEPWVFAWEQIWVLVVSVIAMLQFSFVTPYSVIFMAFSLALSYFRMWATFCGIMNTKKSKSWKVTKKAGVSSGGSRALHKPYTIELVAAVYYILLSVVSFVMFQNWFIGAQCGVFAIVALLVSFGDWYM